MSETETLEILLNKKAKLQSQINGSSFDGSIEIKTIIPLKNF